MIERSKYYTTADPPACSCPDWQYRGHIRPCKHIRRLQEGPGPACRQHRAMGGNGSIGVYNRQGKNLGKRALRHPKLRDVELRSRLHTPGRPACPYSGDADYPQTDAYGLPIEDANCPMCLGETLADVGGSVVDEDATEGP